MERYALILIANAVADELEKRQLAPDPEILKQNDRLEDTITELKKEIERIEKELEDWKVWHA